jgi:hypothetical protein
MKVIIVNYNPKQIYGSIDLYIPLSLDFMNNFFRNISIRVNICRLKHTTLKQYIYYHSPNFNCKINLQLLIIN